MPLWPLHYFPKWATLEPIWSTRREAWLLIFPWLKNSLFLFREGHSLWPIVQLQDLCLWSSEGGRGYHLASQISKSTLVINGITVVANRSLSHSPTNSVILFYTCRWLWSDVTFSCIRVRNNGKVMEVTSELMDSDDANVCQQLGLASADYKSKLCVIGYI